MKNIVNQEKIKLYLEDNCLSKTSFAKICGISYGTLNRIMTGRIFT